MSCRSELLSPLGPQGGDPARLEGGAARISLGPDLGTLGPWAWEFRWFYGDFMVIPWDFNNKDR